ncbi:F-actin-uncapping protein LRRC16A isoform 3-T3 [Pholidichthys leucotaenia]
MTEELPNELLESVREAVGRRVKLTLRRKVQLEVKGDKVETRVLALASHRAFLLTARVPSKVEQSFNYLEIQGISSNKTNQLVLEFDRGSWSLRLSSCEEADEVIRHIGGCLRRICPAAASPLKVIRRLSVKPAERTAALHAAWEDQGSADPGPCGGFSHQYWCVCDYLGLPCRDEVQWDVDTIYLSQDTRELNLQDFVHLENRDLVAIIAALEFNQWFTRLSTKDYKLSTDVCEQIVRVASRSAQLEELVLDNAGLKSDFAQKLAAALSHNPASSLHTLVLSNNSLEDKGGCALGAHISKLPMGLKHLNLSRTSLSPKGINVLCQSLCANPVISSTLTHLDLSGNSLRGDDILNLHSFLSHPNSLETLDLSNSDCSLEQVCASLLRGSLKRLSVLNMSKTVFSHRKCKEISSSFKQFFSSALALSSVSLSGTKLPLEALKSLLLGLGCNPNLSDVSLDLSCCELRSAGSQILEGCIAEIPNISSLDISDNGLDMDLTTLLVWLAKNRSIRHLSLGRNFSNIKSKNVAQVLNMLVHMIQEEESPLTSLSLADSRLKADLSIVLNAVGSNSSLTRLDISGNAMGDMGAKMLAKALQINTKLRTLVWDRNSVSPQGLQDVAAALEKNYTIRFMPVPIMDAAQALKTNPEKTEDALMKMEQYLLRNHETRKYLQEQAYRLQQGIVTTTTQQMMDTMCVRVQDHLNSLRFSETPSVQEDMKVAENLMKDARNSKTLLPNLYHLRSGASAGSCVGAIQDKLESMAGEVASVLDQQLQVMLASMVDAAEGLCPHVMKRSDGLRQDLLTAGGGRMTIPRSFVTDALLEQSGVDIINKISEVKLAVASFLSDRIVDEILESLSRSQHTLADHLIRKDQPLLCQNAQVEAEVLDETVLQPGNQDQDLDQDLDQELEEMDCTRVTTTGSAPQEPEQNSIMGKLDEGLEDFFFKTVTKLSFKRSSVKAQESTDKKRESRRSGFFNLIKSRASRSEKSQGAASISPPPQPAASSSSTAAPQVQETTVKSPLSPVRTLPSVMEPPPPAAAAAAPSNNNHSSTESEVEATPTSDQPTEEEEKEEEEKNPHLPLRHIGIPVMGLDVMAEMKARQERMAAGRKSDLSLLEKVDGDKAKSDVSPAVPPDSEDSRPEPAPRSKPPSVTPKPSPPQPIKAPLLPRNPGPLSPVSPVGPSSFSISDDSNETAGSSPKAPLPASRLKRVPSEQEKEGPAISPEDALSPLDADLPTDSDAFDPPDGPGRQCSSLKHSSSPPVATAEEERERAKSLPAYASPPSLFDTDRSPAEENAPDPPASVTCEVRSEESSEETPSM